MSGLLSNRLGVPLFLMRVCHRKELHMLNKDHRNGLSSCRFGCRLGCHMGSRFGMGLQPLWHAVCLRNIAGEIQFSGGKNISQTPYTTSTLRQHNLSVRRTVTVFFNTTWETTVNRYQR